MRVRVRISLLLSLSLSIALAAAPAAAQKPDDKTVEQAKTYFEAGKQAYEAGQYMTAAMAFEEAYRLSPLAPIAFSLAQAYRKGYFEDKDPAKLKRAVELYRKYLEDVPTGGRRDDAISNLSDLEPLLARLEEQQRAQGKGPIGQVVMARGATQLMIMSRTPGARASVDGGAASEVPAAKEVTPGKHTIRVEAPGHFPEEVEALAVDGELAVVNVNLRPQPAKLTLRASGADVSIDGRPAGAAGRTLEVGAGKHFVAVTKRGHYAWTREVTLERGQELKLDANLETTTQRAVSYWVLGGSGALLIAGTVTTVLALGAQSDAQAFLDRMGQEPLTPEELDEYERLVDRRDRYRTASFVLYGSAVVVGVTGLLLYIMDTPRVEAPGGSSIVPVVGAEGAGVSWTGTF